ncbi:MAG: murein biosynthesis integral membrane protein MurJ [Clostridium sp.]
MKETAILIMIATITSKILGFGREIVTSYFYGTGSMAAAYNVALTIPATVFAMIGVGISTGFIPMYSRIEKESGIKSADRFTSNMTNFVLVICTIIAIVCFIFTEYVVKIFAIALDGQTLQYAIVLTRYTIVGVYFTALVYIFSGYLNLKGNFVVPALVGIPMNIVVIASIVLSSNGNVTILGIGLFLSLVVQLLFLVPYVKKSGYKHRFLLDRHDTNLKEMVVVAVPVIIGVSVNQINTIVDKNIASTISYEAISVLSYSVKLSGFVQGIFVMSIATAMYPLISKMGAEKNIEGLKKSLNEAIISVSLLVIPASIGFMVFAEPIVRLLYGRGKMTEADVMAVASTLFFFAIGMIGYGLREVISKAFYSIRDAKTPMLNAAFAVLINIILSITLSRFMGINGLALATSLAGIICTITLTISLKKKIGSIGLKVVAISMVKILVSSILMGIASYASYIGLYNIVGDKLSLIIAILVAGIVYFGVIYFMKIDEVNKLIEGIKSKISRKK